MKLTNCEGQLHKRCALLFTQESTNGSGTGFIDNFKRTKSSQRLRFTTSGSMQEKDGLVTGVQL